MHLTFVALDGLMRVKVFRSLSENVWSLFQQEEKTLHLAQLFALFTSTVGRPPLAGWGWGRRQTPSQDIPLGMFTPNCSLWMCYPTSFLNKFSIWEFLQFTSWFCIPFVYLTLVWGMWKQYDIRMFVIRIMWGKKLLSPTRKLDNGIRCLCLFH